MLLKFNYILISALLLLFLPLNRGNAASVIEDVTEPNLHIIRKLLVTAINSSKTTDSLYNNLGSIKNRTSLINGYMGTLQALKAKHTWNPYYKIKYLNNAEKTFKNAVTGDPSNIEIRFMRFSVEHNVPGFLGYTKNLVDDRTEIIKQIGRKHYSSADAALVKTIITFLIDSKRCTPAEHSALTQHLASL
jgi:helix-turn-helix protein